MLRLVPQLGLGLVVLLVAGCGTQGTYDLHWTIACETSPTDGCPISSAKDCANVGLDAVAVVAIRGTASTRTLFPCFGPSGPVGQGPELDQGAVVLEVSGLSPGGQLLAGPVGVNVQIPAEGAISTTVTLPRPPECNDGADNDADGLVDAMDPDCLNTNPPHE